MTIIISVVRKLILTLQRVNLDLAETNKALLAEHEQLLKLRSGIDKAIKEMDKLASHKIMPISFDQAVAVDVCIRILKKYR